MSSASPENSLEPTPLVAPAVPGAGDDKETYLKLQIENDPLDILRQLELVQWYESNGQFSEMDVVYEKLHKRFPLYSALWVIQLKGNLQRDQFTEVETLLNECLSGASANNDLDLWMTYLDYVRRKNNLITGGQEARAIVIKAFDLVMQKCAVFEPLSAKFWSDYLQFLESWKPANKFEQQERIDLLRKLYKVMLTTPFDSLERMWKKYTQWEQETSNLNARKFIGELSGEYMKARSLYQEWSNATSGLRRISPMNLSTCNKNNIAQYNEDDIIDVEQLQTWLDWIQWEKENKLTLPEETLKERITYVYGQAVQYMVFCPEIWYDYVMYLADAPIEDRIRILSSALLANPSSPSLTFKLGECYELENNLPMLETTYQTTTDYIFSHFKILKGNQETDPVILSKHKEKLTFIYCIYMNTMKRLSGLAAARQVFGKCRKLKGNLSHAIYIENAYLESRNSNDNNKTAMKVLELGLKYFKEEGEYILKYMNFLTMLNKDSNIKTLFETSVDKIVDPVQLKLIYKKMISYESKFGSLNNVYSLESRFFERFPEENLIETFTDRYEIQNENYIKKLELAYMLENDQMAMIGTFSMNGNSKKRAMKTSNHMSPRKRMSRSSQEVPDAIVEMLKVLPKRQYFSNVILDPESLINFLVDQVEIPEDRS